MYCLGVVIHVSDDVLLLCCCCWGRHVLLDDFVVVRVLHLLLFRLFKFCFFVVLGCVIRSDPWVGPGE